MRKEDEGKRKEEGGRGNEEGGIDEARQRQRCHMSQPRVVAGSAEEFQNNRLVDVDVTKIRILPYKLQLISSTFRPARIVSHTHSNFFTSTSPLCL